MRVLVAKEYLSHDDSELIHAAWEGRRKNPIRWWRVRSRFGIKEKIVNSGAMSSGLTIAMPKKEFDSWRRRHGEA